MLDMYPPRYRGWNSILFHSMGVFMRKAAGDMRQTWPSGFREYFRNIMLHCLKSATYYRRYPFAQFQRIQV